MFVCGGGWGHRHEHDEHRGKYTDFGLMKMDIECMKQLNINAVRTCHYPNRNLWCVCVCMYVCVCVLISGVCVCVCVCVC